MSPVAIRPQSAAELEHEGGCAKHPNRFTAPHRLPVGMHRNNKRPRSGSDGPVGPARRPGAAGAAGSASGNRGGKRGRRTGLAALQERLRSKLAGSQFRWINERLYSQPGNASFDMFKTEPSLFHSYHEGFREQVARWPVNPLDILINKIKALPPTSVVADMGCGEARLSASVTQTVHSFDLVAANDRVVACDVAHVPLADSSVDCVVFCLALMGTDYAKFLAEAARICKPGGQLMIAEVRSRVEGAGAAADGEEDDFAATARAMGGAAAASAASEDPAGAAARRKLTEEEAAEGVRAFVDAVQDQGFSVRRVNRKNKMFLVVLAERDDARAAGGKKAARKAAAAASADSDAPVLTGAARRVAAKQQGNSGGRGGSTGRSGDGRGEAGGKARSAASGPALVACKYRRR